MECGAFDLMIGTIPLRQSDPVVLGLSGMKCRIFYRLPMEDSCWWVPLDGGTPKCLGQPALRDSEFATLCDAARTRQWWCAD